MIELDGKKRNVCAWIPARGGSKGVPGKALRELGGKPLIAHTISAALDISGVDVVCVNTDDKAIREVALACGADVPFLRPKELAGDRACLEDALAYQWDWYLRNRRFVPDIHIGMSPTYPFREKGRVDSALSIINDNRAVFNVRSLVRMNHPQDSFRLIHNQRLEALDISGGAFHAGNPLFRDCFSLNVVVDCRPHIEGFGPTPLEISDVESVDIDEMDDYFLACCIEGQMVSRGADAFVYNGTDFALFGKFLDDCQPSDDGNILVHPDFPMITSCDIRDFRSFCSGQRKIVVSGCDVNMACHPFRWLKREGALYTRYAVDISQEIRGCRQRYPRVVQWVPALVYLPEGTRPDDLLHPDGFVMYVLPSHKCLDRTCVLDRYRILLETEDRPLRASEKMFYPKMHP